MNEQNEFSDEENFKFFGLGGCNEVGRSCHIIEYKNKVIMLDSGMHPALSGHASFPYFDEYDISKVDILLISHFHVDHSASLPYVMQQSNFRGKVFMTGAKGNRFGQPYRKQVPLPGLRLWRFVFPEGC